MQIQRKEYLSWLRGWKDQKIIKVVSGVRRCGKSTLFDIYRSWLIGAGVEESRIIDINFESVEFEDLREYHKLHDYIVARLRTGVKNYIFIDEIQHVPNYERAVDSLFLRDECDVYITGSNAYFMSGELATVLSGRYVELRMLPLSFAEFCMGVQDQMKRTVSSREAFRLYLKFGSFPYLTQYQLTDGQKQDYLRDVYNSVLLKDIVSRLGVSDVTTLENVTKFLLFNVGNITSTAKIVNTLKSAGKGADQKTIDKYIHALTDSLMFYAAPRYNLKGRVLLSTSPKYYTVDTGFRNLLVKTESGDVGQQIENIVYLELLRRGYEVYVGQGASCEIDFVCTRGDEKAYFQVEYLLADESVVSREFNAFHSVRDNYPKYVLSLDEYDMSRDGIIHKNLIDWLMD